MEKKIIMPGREGNLLVREKEKPVKKQAREQEQLVKEKEELEQETKLLRLQLNEQVKMRELEHQLWVLSVRGEEHLQRKISALDAQVETRDKAIRLLKDRLKGSQDLLDEHTQSIKRLAQELRDSRSEFYEQEEKMEDLEMHTLELEIDLREKSAQVKTLLASQNLEGTALEKQLRSQIESQAQTIKELSVKADGQEKKIQTAQESAFQLRRKARHDAMDDGEIRILLQNEFMEMAKEWAKKWGTPELNANDALYNTAALRQECEKVAPASGLKNVPPRVVLTALLSQYIAEHVFQQPFPQLLNDGGTGRARTSSQGTTDFSEIMARLYAAFLKVDEAEAHAWRSRTLQLLSKVQASSSSLFSDGDNVPKWLLDSQSRYIETLTNAFLQGPTRPLHRTLTSSSDSPSRKQELLDLITKSIQLSSNVWKQRTSLGLRGFSHYRQIPYRCDSKEMEAHRMHRLEKGDTSKDGDHVAMVVHPGFVGFGNEDGEGYDKEKVWAKAVVVLA